MLQLKAIKISKHMSQETMAFTANVYWKNKKVGTARNDGRGGMTFVDFHYTDAATVSEIIAAIKDKTAIPAWNYLSKLLYRPNEERFNFIQFAVEALLYDHDRLKQIKNYVKKPMFFDKAKDTFSGWTGLHCDETVQLFNDDVTINKDTCVYIGGMDVMKLLEIVRTSELTKH